METVSIKFPDSARMKNQASYSGVQFAFAARLGKEKYEQVTSWTSCRESTVGQARRVITGNWHGNSPYSDCSGKVDYDAMRLLVYFKHTASRKDAKIERNGRMKRYIRCSLDILHFFEKMGHIKRSKVYATKHNLPDSNMVYLFEGSGEWMRSPHLLSLYALLIRCGKFEEFESGIKDLKDFLKKVKTIRTDYKTRCYDRGYRFTKWPFTFHDDINYLHNIGPKMAVLMERRKQIFSKKKKIDHYRSTSHNSDGIAQLVYGTVDDKEVQRIFIASCDKYEMKSIAK